MTDTHFSVWFKKELQRREWTLSDFAHRAKIDPSMVSRWARGKRNPNAASADLIADTLLLDRDTVLAAAGIRPVDNPETNPVADELCALIRRIDFDQEPRFGESLSLMLRSMVKSGRFVDDDA